MPKVVFTGSHVGESGMSEQNIKPSDIAFDGDKDPAVRGFGKCEIEHTIGRLIYFYRERQGDRWRPFKLPELLNFYTEKGWDPALALFGIVGTWFDDATIVGGPKRGFEPFILWPNGELTISEKFIAHLPHK